ncbi:MAG: hypothetical protein KBT03_03355 [Bacteroidales bacterium]|nr:hypothetical protein [Candidatus Scybalousia scybalohippi]
MMAEVMMEMLEESGKVIKSVKYTDGTVLDIEMVEDMENVIAFEVVELDAYEANGYDVDGLATAWMEVQ